MRGRFGRRQSTLIQSTLESIRFDICARIEAEQQHGQRADDYDWSYHYIQTVFICKLHCHGASVGFDNPSFEIRINAASRVILNPAVHRLPAF